MTRQEINKKISDLTEQIGSLNDALEEIKKRIADPTLMIMTARGNATPEDIEAALNLETAVTNLNKTKSTIEDQISQAELLLEQYKTMTPTDNDIIQDNATNSMTQADKEANDRLVQQHPERTVDGIYYADDNALQKAKEAQEQRLKAEQQQATAEAAAKANKLAAAMKVINETLYGTDNVEVLTQLQGSVGGAELSSVLGNATSVRARQHLLDFTKFKDDFKAPNAGKEQIKYKTISSKRHKYRFNYDIFSTIDTEIKAYWLGFLVADGYVDRDSLELTVQAKDMHHLERFRDIFNGTIPDIKYKHSANAYRFLLCSVEMVQDLASKGCIQGKLTRTFPNENQVPTSLINHFMRGYFDGDGSIYFNKYYSLQFSVIGSSSFLDHYERILIDHCSRKSLSKRRSQSERQTDCYEIRYGGNKRCLDIFNFLYKDATVYLKRKKEKFDYVFCRP